MKRIIGVGVAIVFLAVFVVGVSAQTKEPHTDKSFVKEAAIGGMFEVEAGKVAAQKATSQDVKSFGQRMVDDHSKANDELMKLAQAKSIPVPKELDSTHKDHMDKLNKAAGADFDKQYIDLMVKDHEKDVKEFTKESEKGKDPEVKAFAAKTLPTLKEHLKIAQDIQAKMGVKKSK